MTSVLEVSNLKKSFYQSLKEIQVLKWVNLSVEKWQVYWFLWPNGSWKTTTLKCILWFLKYNEGNIKIFWDQTDTNPKLYTKIGYAPENAYFYDHLQWLEFLVFMGELSGLNKEEAELNGIDLLDRLGLSEAKNRFVKSYSKWMKQRLWLAASLINNPELLFWDEPMSWLDPLWRVLVKELMIDLKNKWKTIFFNTHILSDVQEISDKFWIIYNWRIIYEEFTKNITQNLEDVFKQCIAQEENKVEIK